MKAAIFASLLLVGATVQAQYYYNDIIGTQETNRQMKNYVANKVRTVTATGYDANGTKSTDFVEVQEVKENGRLLKVSSVNDFKKTTSFSRFDSEGRIVRLSDTTGAIGNVTTYAYDDAGRLKVLENTTTDSTNDFNQVETHRWMYDANGKVTGMWRTINGKDSLEVRLKPDENGNPGDERTYRKGVETGQYYYLLDDNNKPTYVQTGSIYYYYDDQNRLTDVVRFNLKAKRLLPDLLFEYNDKNLVIQKITTTTSVSLNYLIWRYVFDEKQLKTKEVLFNRDKKITGRIEYSYTFGN